MSDFINKKLTHKKDLLTFEQFLNNPRNEKNRVLPDFQIEKVDLSEIKPVKNLVPLTRESKWFNDNFIIDFPEAREYETHDNQDVPSELLINSEPDFTDQIPRETDNEIFEQEQNNIEGTEINDFIKRPCIKNIGRKVSFNQKVEGINIDGDYTETKLNNKYTLKRQFHLLSSEQNLLNMYY